MLIDKEFEINTEVLNEIDFIHYLKEYSNLGRMMMAIENKYNSFMLPPELEGEIFNYYSEDDFMNYLANRYPTKLYFYPITDYLIDYRRDEQ